MSLLDLFVKVALAQDAPQTTTTPTPGSGTTGTINAQTTPITATSDGISLLPSTGDLVEKIQSGNIHLSDIPAFISYFIQIGIILSGTVAFIMILVGGYQYIIGGVYSEMRDKGKQTLIYAISGLVLAMLAYGIVTLVQLAATAL